MISWPSSWQRERPSASSARRCCIGYQGAVERHRRARGDADRLAAIDGDQDVLDARVGVVFRRGHRSRGSIPRPDPGWSPCPRGCPGSRARRCPRRASVPGSARPIRQTDLGRADVEDRHQPRSIGGNFVPAAQSDCLAHSSRVPPLAIFLLAAAQHEEILRGRAQIDLAHVTFQNALVDDQMLEGIELLLPARLPAASRSRRHRESGSSAARKRADRPRCARRWRDARVTASTSRPRFGRAVADQHGQAAEFLDALVGDDACRCAPRR